MAQEEKKEKLRHRIFVFLFDFFRSVTQIRLFLKGFSKIFWLFVTYPPSKWNFRYGNTIIIKQQEGIALLPSPLFWTVQSQDRIQLQHHQMIVLIPNIDLSTSVILSYLTRIFGRLHVVLVLYFRWNKLVMSETLFVNPCKPRQFIVWFAMLLSSWWSS